jgi:kynurenine formamidase
MRTYPGLSEPKVEVLWDYDSSRAHYGGEAEFFIASLHLCGNTGTYVDAPVHRFRGGASLADVPLDRLAHVPAVVVDARDAGSRGSGRRPFGMSRSGTGRFWCSPDGPNIGGRTGTSTRTRS